MMKIILKRVKHIIEGIKQFYLSFPLKSIKTFFSQRWMYSTSASYQRKYCTDALMLLAWCIRAVILLTAIGFYKKSSRVGLHLTRGTFNVSKGDVFPTSENGVTVAQRHLFSKTVLFVCRLCTAHLRRMATGVCRVASSPATRLAP